MLTSYHAVAGDDQLRIVSYSIGIELSINRIDIAITPTLRYKKTHKHNGGLIGTDKFSVQNISIKSGSGGWI